MKPLCGSTQTTASTIITIPPYHAWKGTVALSVRDMGSAEADISIQGGGAEMSPPSGTVILRVYCRNGGTSLGTPVVLITGDASATLRLTHVANAAAGMANGVLVEPGA